VVVLANVGELFGGEDISLALRLLHHVKVYRFFHPVPPRLPELGENSIKFFMKFFVIPDSRSIFFVKYFKQMERILKHEDPDLLISTAPPFSSLVAAKLLAKRLKIPFVADLRDPWSENPYTLNRPLNRLLEAWTLRDAAGVIVANDMRIYEEVRSYNSNVLILEHTYDPDEYPEPLPHPGEVWVSYVGSVITQAQRNLLRAVGERLPDGYSLRIFGPGTDRILTREEALKEMVSSDVLLVVEVGKRPTAGSSSKFYEYVGAGKPVVVVSYNPFLRRKASELGLSVADPNPYAVVKAIVEAYTRRTKPNSKRHALRLDVGCCKLVGFLRKLLAFAAS